MNEVAPTGIEWPEFKERYARLRESVTLMRKLWSQEFVSFEGTFYRTRDATLYDRPSEGVPLYVAAGGPQVAKYVGRVADGFICTSGKGAELYRDQLLPALADGAREAGRDPNSIDRLIEIKVSFDSDHQRALDDTRYWGALALTSDEKTGVEDPREMERLADALPVERTAKRWIVATDPDECVERIKFYTDLGLDHLVFHFPGPDQQRALDLFGERVVPKLRQLTPAPIEAKPAATSAT
jgi:coenzyme F420-dependent glucose-6-phosphate dehydrogenase